MAEELEEVGVVVVGAELEEATELLFGRAKLTSLDGVL